MHQICLSYCILRCVYLRMCRWLTVCDSILFNRVVLKSMTRDSPATFDSDYHRLSPTNYLVLNPTPLSVGPMIDWETRIVLLCGSPAVGLFSGVIPMKEEWSGWFRFSWGILGSFSNGLSSLRPNLTLLGRMKKPLCRRIRSAEVLLGANEP